MEKQTVLEKLEQLEKTHESRQSKTKLQHDIGKELQIPKEIQYGPSMNHFCLSKLMFIVKHVYPTPWFSVVIVLKKTNFLQIFL